MIRRALSFIMAVVILCSCMMATVYASNANDSGWIELLEYDTLNSSGKNWFSYTTSGTFEITLPRQMRLSKIDMLVSYSYGTKPDYVEVAVGSKWVALEIHEIQNGLARIVGRIDYTFYNSVKVRFRKSATASSTVEVFSCKVTPLTVQEFVADAAVVIGSSTYKVGTTINISAADDITATNTAQIRIDVKDWQKYDELSIWGSSFVMSLDSFRASISTSGLPITINYIACNDAGSGFDYYYGSSEGYGELTSEYGKYLFCVTIDLTNVDRTLSDPLYLYITGQWNKTYHPSFTCQYVNGHVFTADTSDVTFWVRFKEFLNSCFSGLTSAINTGFSNVNSWITAQTNTLSARLNNIWQEIEDGFENVGNWFERYFGQDSTDAEEFQDDAAQKGEEMDDLNNQLQEVTKPSVSDIETDLDGFVDSGTSDMVATKLAVLTGDTLIVAMFMITLTVALLSYILFGKR